MNDEEVFAIELPARPYPGLRPFDLSEWPIFFGREVMIDAVISRLVSHQFIVVHGDSGSGKSSLIRAGVLPRLLQDQARGGARWRTCIAQPGIAPLRNLAIALARLDGREDDSEYLLLLRRALQQCQRAPAALAGLMLQGGHDHLCILVDQFEEIFEAARRPDAETEARLLADALVAMAAQPTPGLYVALTMRSEFLGACARFPGLAEAVNAHQYLLPPMGAADPLRAIREPAQLYGGDITPDLAERLAQDALGPDGLPLVQHALMLMREQAGAAEGWRLTAASYPADGLASLLSGHADQVAAEVLRKLPEWPRLVEDIFRALSTVTAEGHAVRRPQTLQRLSEVTGAPLETVAKAVDLLRADGVSFLVPRPDQPLEPEVWIDIGHEALLRSWRALADPLDGWLVREFRNGLVWRSMLVQADSFERDADNVLSPATTEERQRWLKRRSPVWSERYGGGWDRVQALLTASVAAKERLDQERAQQQQEIVAQRLHSTRMRRLAWMAGGVFVVVAMFAALALNFQQKTDAAFHAYRVSQDQLAQQSSAYYAQTVGSLQHVQAIQVQLNDALKSGSPTAVLQAADTAAKQLSGAASGLQKIAWDLSPHIQVFIGDDSQRAAAEAFGTRLGALRVGNMKIVAERPKLVERQMNAGVLRCFRAEECRDYGPKLLALANSLLDAPTLQLQDLSSQFETNAGLKPLQFEVWFGHVQISLKSP